MMLLRRICLSFNSNSLILWAGYFKEGGVVKMLGCWLRCAGCVVLSWFSSAGCVVLC